MKRLSILIMAAAMLAACADQGRQATLEQLNGADGVIYGQDSVRDITEHNIHGSTQFRRNLKASAALVLASQFRPAADGGLLLNDETVEEKFRTCEDFKMGAQIAAAFCSGVLVAPDRILTASHCLAADEGARCEDTRVVFGYSNELNRSEQKKIATEQVYRCKKVLSIHNYGEGSEVDYALVQLDRPVEGVTPVPVDTKGKFHVGQAVYAVGYPVGTPKKIARGEIRRLDGDHHNPQASLDVYAGNSGSPIFDTLTNELVGILSNGEEDFITTPAQCQEVKRCSDQGCLGEAIVPLTKIMKAKN